MELKHIYIYIYIYVDKHTMAMVNPSFVDPFHGILNAIVMVGLIGCIENSGFAEVHQVDKAQARAHEVQIPASHTNPGAWRPGPKSGTFFGAVY